MANLVELAKKYFAYEKSDDADFQRKARLLQSIWREEKGFPIGKQIGQVMRSPPG